MPAKNPSLRSCRKCSAIRTTTTKSLSFFTEHRDTADFLVRRLEGLGFTDQVALIHGGLDYQETRAAGGVFSGDRRRKEGQNYLVATDAAGEGINLQFLLADGELRYPLESGAA